MIKSKIIILILVLFSFEMINAQVNILNAKIVEDIGEKNEQQLLSDNDGPIPYGYVDDRDVMWSKVVWEFVDLNQKINLPYYFPVDTINISSKRRSLFDTLLKGIKQGKIKEIYDDSYFTSNLSREDVISKITDIRKEDDYIDTFSLTSDKVGGYMLKGMWYFDKRQGEMKYRLLGLAPMGEDVGTIYTDLHDDTLYPLFWVFFPDARVVLHDSKVFNPMNSAQPISYDHLLNARRFNSVIVREENIYGNRAIEDYIRGNSLFQLLEANKIKEDIRNREIDMWNY